MASGGSLLCVPPLSLPSEVGVGPGGPVRKALAANLPQAMVGLKTPCSHMGLLVRFREQQGELPLMAALTVRRIGTSRMATMARESTMANSH